MCPKCKQPMILLELDAIEIDHCPECLGTWLDAGEIESICDRAGGDLDALTRAIRQARRGDKANIRCPRCNRRLRAMHFDEPAALELDACPRKHGFWFDRGEMRSLIEAREGGRTGAVALFFADLYRTELSEHTEGENNA